MIGIRRKRILHIGCSLLLNITTLGANDCPNIVERDEVRFFRLVFLTLISPAPDDDFWPAVVRASGSNKGVRVAAARIRLECFGEGPVSFSQG